MLAYGQSKGSRSASIVHRIGILITVQSTPEVRNYASHISSCCVPYSSKIRKPGMDTSANLCSQVKGCTRFFHTLFPLFKDVEFFSLPDTIQNIRRSRQMISLRLFIAKQTGNILKKGRDHGKFTKKGNYKRCGVRTRSLEVQIQRS